MNFFERTVIAVMLPAVAWAYVIGLKLYVMKVRFGEGYRPSSDEVLFAQVVLTEGAVLCLVALYAPFRAWRSKRLDKIMMTSATASALFLVWWAPSAVIGLIRRTNFFG
jgi:hypothetical protein